MEAPSVRDAIAGFGAWLELHRARNTGLLFRSRLRSLANDPELGPRPLSSLTLADVEAWLARAGRWPDGRLKAPDTRRANAIAFLRLQAWAVEHGHLTVGIVPRLEKPAGRERERIPTAAETERLLAAAPPAFALIYRALRQCGARPNELCRATIADWQRDQRAIVLEDHKTAEKTGRPRRIAVGRRLEAILLEAIGERREGPIFLSPAGRAWRPQRLSTLYRQLRDRAGLPKDLCLYLARHEHGTKVCRKLGIKAAADALGHTSIKTTQRYAHSTDDERAENQDAVDA
jgi:integrase